MRVLAVDFGTSNTVAAVSIDGAPPRLLTIDGSPLVPSSIYLGEDGLIAVGRDADRQARIDPSRYEPNPKRRIDDGDMLLGTDVIPVHQAIAAVLGRVLQEYRRQFGGDQPDVVRLTHPARWRKSRRDVLIAGCREAGFTTEPILVPEPVGAATHFATQSGHTLEPGSAMAVYDLGGGTFDVAIVQKTGSGFDVVAEQGLPDLGGLDFDHAILEHVAKTQQADAPEEWAKLNRPTDTASRRAQRALAVDIREGKEALSRNPHTDIAFPAPFSDVHITRSEFEELIRPNLARSVELLQTTIDEANLTPKQLAGVYLVGGSSRVPLVARLIQEGMGVTPTTLDQPESTVATGALYLNVGGKQGAAARPNPTPATPQTRPPGPGFQGPGRPGAGMADQTTRVNPGSLPQIRTVRPTGPPPGGVRRLGPPTNQPGSGPMVHPPTHSNPRPTSGVQGRPGGPNQRPPTGQHRPPTGPVSPPRPAPGAPRPITGNQPPLRRPATGATQIPRVSSPAPARAPQKTTAETARPIIWAAIAAVALILIAILIAALS